MEYMYGGDGGDGGDRDTLIGDSVLRVEISWRTPAYMCIPLMMPPSHYSAAKEVLIIIATQVIFGHR